jgi:peptidylprolyl isomerase
MRWTIVAVLAALSLGCGEEFAGWEKLPSGVRYEDVEEGKGPEVKPGDLIRVHYTGWQARGGEVFDTSRKRGQPFQFKVGEGAVIRGWDEGVVGMKVGGIRKLFIPSDMGYGASGKGKIPPYADLMFEVELVGFAKPPAPPKVRIENLKVGTGAEAKAGTMVKVHYTGWLANGGSKFDSSLDRGKPFEFKLGAGKVIKGWDDGVVGMKVGGKRKLHIPAALGYGAGGSGATIPPNSDLVFEVELLDVRQE